MSYKIEIYGLSDIGRVREKNEDSFCFDAELGFMIVGDGMGGHKRGDVASKMATSIVYEKYKEMILNKMKPEVINKDYFIETNILIWAFDYANSVIWNKSQENEEFKGMGTTLTSCIFYDKNRFSIVHIGDSRVYLVRDNKILQLTEDDSFVMEQYRSGAITLEEAKKSSYRNVLTKAIGAKQYNSYFVYQGKVKGNDIFLLTTDGLTRGIDENEIFKIVNSNVFGPDTIRKLIDTANKKDGSDNITVVMARVNVSGFDLIFDKII
jgi:serine/threonine protein phosphatase PrpC